MTMKPNAKNQVEYILHNFVDLPELESFAEIYTMSACKMVFVLCVSHHWLSKFTLKYYRYVCTLYV